MRGILEHAAAVYGVFSKGAWVIMGRVDVQDCWPRCSYSYSLLERGTKLYPFS